MVPERREKVLLVLTRIVIRRIEPEAQKLESSFPLARLETGNENKTTIFSKRIARLL
jgi:hypothetical protein